MRNDKALIKQLENLREHCSSMIDKDDPESIWRGDVEAIDWAIAIIKAYLGLFNNNKAGGINKMSSKTKVTIEAPDGVKQEYECDTALVFTVDEAAEFLDGHAKLINANAAYVGKDIPEPIFAKTIASLVGSFIEHRQKGHPALASYDLNQVGQYLRRMARDKASRATEEQKKTDLETAMEGLFKTFF